MTNYEDHWMIAEQSEPRTKRVAARSTAQIIEAYQNGESMTDAEVEQAYHALVRLKNAVLEVGNDVSLVIPWVVPKLQSFEGFMKHRAERREKAIQQLEARLRAEVEAEKARIDIIGRHENSILRDIPWIDADKIQDPDKGWGPWLNRRDSVFFMQTWKPFEDDDYVEVSSNTVPWKDAYTNRDYAKNLWWGYTDSGIECKSVIRRARKWVGPGDPPK